MKDKTAKQHAMLLRKVKDVAGRAALKREPLPDSLIKEVSEADDYKIFCYLVKLLVEKEGTITTSSPLQELVLTQAESGFEDQLVDYIRLYPFNADLQMRLWRLMAKNKEMCLEYISRWSFSDKVLDAFWAGADEFEKCIYVIKHEVSKEMGLKVWQNVEKDDSLLFYSKLYLQNHPVPKGLLALVAKEETKDYDFSDLIEYSTQHFYPEDEVTLVEQELEILRFYLRKFKELSAEAQVALLNTDDMSKILSYAEKVGVWDQEAQKLIVSQEGPLKEHPDWVTFIAEQLAEPFDIYNHRTLCEILSR